jgi:hypothetical protein
VGIGRLTAQVIPVANVFVAAPEPCQRNKINLFVFVQRPDCTCKLGLNWVIGMVFQAFDHVVVGWIRARVGHCDDIPYIEFLALEDEIADRI